MSSGLQNALRGRVRWPIAIVLVGCASLTVAAIVSWWAPFVPSVHDEFSYLLAADTLLHGRLANPTPEFWQPFQSIHIVMDPAYASKYPLGQGLVIALGWAVFGLPIAGCWIAAGLCAASITWMLAGVTSRYWAVVGGLLIALHPAMQWIWSQSLVHGWLTATGSGLLIGCLLRLRRRFVVSAALAGGIGVSLLAMTRPFEGFVATSISVALLCGWWARWPLRFRLAIAMRAIPIASLPIAATLAMIALHNTAVTGRFDRLPYQMHEDQYAVAPLFVFGQPLTPSLEGEGHLSAVVRQFHYGWSLESYLRRAGLGGWWRGWGEAWWKLARFWTLLALLPLLSIGFWPRFRVTGYIGIAIAAQLMASSSVCWIYAYYLSPVVPWLSVVGIVGLRRLSHVASKSRRAVWATPHFVAGTLLAIQLLWLIGSGPYMAGRTRPAWALRRAEIAAQLQSRPGTHLVLVHYRQAHDPLEEWVYNTADLQETKVLWARGERQDWNARLAAIYANHRTLWRLDADSVPPQLRKISDPPVVREEAPRRESD